MKATSKVLINIAGRIWQSCFKSDNYLNGFLAFFHQFIFFSLLFLSCSSSSASSSSSSPPPPPLSSSFCSSSFSFFFYGVSLRGFFLLVVCCCVAAGSHSLASLASTTWCPTANKNAQKEDSNPVLKIKKKKTRKKERNDVNIYIKRRCRLQSKCSVWFDALRRNVTWWLEFFLEICSVSNWIISKWKELKRNFSFQSKYITSYNGL